MSKSYYVYIHRKLDSDEIFYIGVGHGNRAWDFFGRNDVWKEVYEEFGCEVEIFKEDILCRKAALELEVSLQKKHNPIACLQYGGGNLSIVSEETRRKQSESRTGSGNGMYGKTHSDSAKAKMSKAKKGKPGRVLYDWEIENLKEVNKKKIINCRGEVFNSLKEAFPKFQLKSHTSISQQLNGKQETAGKYPDGTKVKWRYYQGEKDEQ
jgi:hypothetical protein